MDVYKFLIYAIPALIVIAAIFHYGRKILRWSDNNHSEKTTQQALIVKKNEKEQIFRNHSSGGMGIPVTSTRYYVTFMLNDKKQRFEVPMVDYIKVKEGDEGTLTFQGTRFVSFEKSKEF